MLYSEYQRERDEAYQAAIGIVNGLGGIGRVLLYYYPSVRFIRELEVRAWGRLKPLSHDEEPPKGYELASPEPIPLHRGRNHCRRWLKRVCDDCPVINMEKDVPMRDARIAKMRET